MKDISTKIDRTIAEAIIICHHVAEKTGTPFFILGAVARDILFSALHDIPTLRKTMDVDVSIRAENWLEYKLFMRTLQESGRAASVSNMPHRLRFDSGVLLDIIPFGSIEHPSGSLSWPSADSTVMSMIGYEEVFMHAELIRISADPICDVRVASIAGLAVLKLLSWNDNPSVRDKDAKDLFFILKNYIETGKNDRLFGADSDIVDSAGSDFDYTLAGPRLLGRDIARLTEPVTHETVLHILETETNSDGALRLAQAMVTAEYVEPGRIELAINLLQQMKIGVLDRR